MYARGAEEGRANGGEGAIEREEKKGGRWGLRVSGFGG
jgi:hypothetical protein